MRAVNDLDRQAMQVLTEATSQLRELARGVTDRAAVTRLEAAMNGLDADRRFLEQGGAAAPRTPTDPAERLRILEAQEAERARLAQEIHDGPAQALANAIFQVDIIGRALEARPGQVPTELRALRDQLRSELGDLRGFISQLRPPLLEEQGLDRALSESVTQLAGRGGPAVEVDLAAADDLLDEARQTVVLRVAQEALRNVRKHAAAHHVRISTRHEPALDGVPGRWVLEIADDGKGFQPGPPIDEADRGGHFGLRFMQERAAMVGAELAIHAVADSGTTVRLTITLS
jgi:two-component system, NarL family, sensor histidine kinase DegS